MDVNGIATVFAAFRVRCFAYVCVQGEKRAGTQSASTRKAVS